MDWYNECPTWSAGNPSFSCISLTLPLFKPWPSKNACSSRKLGLNLSEPKDVCIEFQDLLCRFQASIMFFNMSFLALILKPQVWIPRRSLDASFLGKECARSDPQKPDRTMMLLQEHALLLVQSHIDTTKLYRDAASIVITITTFARTSESGVHFYHNNNFCTNVRVRVCWTTPEKIASNLLGLSGWFFADPAGLLVLYVNLDQMK